LNRISAFKGDHEPCLMLDADISSTIRYQQYGWALMAEQPDRAGLAHVDGPLTVHPIRRSPTLPPLRFVRNGKPKYLRAVVATDLLQEHASWVAVRSQSLRGDQPACNQMPTN
jgi:hypothetical protein